MRYLISALLIVFIQTSRVSQQATVYGKIDSRMLDAMGEGGWFSVLTIGFASCNDNPIDNPPTGDVERTKIISSLYEEEAAIIQNDPNNFIAAFKSGDITFIFRSQRKGHKIISTLETGEPGNSTETHIEINENQLAYKLRVHELVLSEANRISQNLQFQFAARLAGLFELFGTQMLKLSDAPSSSLVQSMYFHNAVINTVARNAKTGSGCRCTPDPGYFVGKKSFWCQEDYYVFPDLILENLAKSGITVKPDNVIIEYLKANRSKVRVPISELYQLEEPRIRFISRVEAQSSRLEKINLLASANPSGQIVANIPEECLEGSDWGCCGNYEGCCWYSNIWCLIHDIECMCCDPWWYCLPGCKKESFCNN